MTRGVDQADFEVPQRQCCSSRLNEYHVDECMNASLNAKWEALGVIVDHGAAGRGVSVFDLDGKPMPVRLDVARSWGVRIPFGEASEAGPPPPLFVTKGAADEVEGIARYKASVDRAYEEKEARRRSSAPRSLPEGTSGVYRDLADVYHQEGDRIVSIADELVADITGRGGEYQETYKGVAEFFVANLILLYERNEMAHDAWRATGWAGNLMTLWGKAKRLMNNMWWFPESDVRREKPLDHFGDTAIYSAFTALLWMSGDERGAER